MDINQANKKIKRAWILSAIAILVSFLDFLLMGIIEVPPQITMIPFCSAFGLLASPIILVLTFMVYRKSRVSAILLFTVNVLERAFTYLWLYVFSTVFIIIYICTAMLSAFIFFQGIRGALAYHQLTNKKSGDG